MGLPVFHTGKDSIRYNDYMTIGIERRQGRKGHTDRRNWCLSLIMLYIHELTAKDIFPILKASPQQRDKIYIMGCS